MLVPDDPVTAASTDYAMFLSVLGALGKLVVLSMMLERGLAFVFEHEWFVKLTTKSGATATDPRTKRLSGLKGLIALGLSCAICFTHKFDVLAVLFGPAEPSVLGVLMTALVAAGGSAGAISLFQGFLNISKDSRDAAIAARKAESEAALAVAKANKDRTEAEAAAAVAAAKAQQAEAEKAEAAARRSVG